MIYVAHLPNGFPVDITNRADQLQAGGADVLELDLRFEELPKYFAVRNGGVVDLGLPPFRPAQYDYDAQAWVDPRTPVEIDEEEAVKVRRRRDDTLRGTDWTQLPDSPLNAQQTAAWRVYRNTLRNVPSQAGFPRNIVWPIDPDGGA